MRRFLLVCFLLVVGCVVKANAASDSLKIEIEVLPELSAYADPLFSAPAYAVLALQNSGLVLSLSTTVILESRASFRVGPSKLRFLERKGKIYHYSAILTLPLGKEIVIPVELDTSEMERGRVVVDACPPVSSLIPQQLVVRVESKLRTLSIPSAQAQLHAYLAERSGANPEDPVATAKLFDTIAFDALNQSSQSPISGSSDTGKLVGTSELFSDQLALFMAVLIWLVGFPVFLYLVRRQKLEQANA
jgi:hypothetical protein